MIHCKDREGPSVRTTAHALWGLTLAGMFSQQLR
jgi:hypothetical protein